MSTGRMPCAFSSRIREPSLEGRAALVDAGGLRLRDTVQLALAPNVGIELGEHGEESLAGGHACRSAARFRLAPRACDPAPGAARRVVAPQEAAQRGSAAPNHPNGSTLLLRGPGCLFQKTP